MALGATARNIVGNVLRRMLLLTVLGIVAGWVLSLLASGLLEALLYGVRPAEPVAFAGTALVLLGVAALAAALPARRAAGTKVAEVLTE
jgi:ABC-type antimicrobial peptide transport system permease subunit